MKKFISKIILFLFLSFLVIVFAFSLKKDSLFEIYKSATKNPLVEKLKNFQEHKNNFDRINLILGSSFIGWSVIPDSLGDNWFSFSNGHQTLYESYKFLEFFKDDMKIDTLIISVQPFDFPKSYSKERLNGMPKLNSNFSIFGKDSITIIESQYVSKTFLNLKHQLFANKLDDRVLMKDKKGFLGVTGRDLDKLYENLKKNKRDELRDEGYFYNISQNPNFTYFNIFDNFANKICNEVVYIITPKSKYYHNNNLKNGYDKIWNNIKNEIKKRNLTLLDYEQFDYSSYNFNFFHDETHLSYDGAKIFTAILKKDL